MAKHGQRATWENDNFKAPKKNDVPPVPEVNKKGKNN